MARTPIELKDPARAALLAWLIPGLGHLYQGRHGKAALYATCILGLYLVGFGLGEGKIVYWRWVNPMTSPEEFRLSYLGQVGVGLPSLPALAQATLRHFDRPPILWGLMAEPETNDINAMHVRLGKLMEIGWLYTMMAGLLNVLAIFDAYAGPALAEDEPDAAPAGPEPKPDGLKAEAGA